MKTRLLILASMVLIAIAVLAACAPSPTPTPQASPTPKAIKAQLFVFSPSSPTITVIDAETNDVIRTADIAGFNPWSWIDDNNYSDGTNLWFGIRNTETNDAEVVVLDLDTLQITTRIPIGKETHWLYTGKPTKDGRLFVAKHASSQMAIIDTKTRKLLQIVDVPTGDKGKPGPGVFGGSVACDVDTATGPDGVERVFYPTWEGDTVVALDSSTAKPLKIVSLPDTNPVMLTAAPDGTVWVQEAKSKSNVILNPVTLDVLARFSTGEGSAQATFSPDGKLGYLAGGGTSVTVADTQTRRVVQTVVVGSNASEVTPHPNGKFLYVAVSKEASVAVIDTSTWKVTKRIPLGTNPSFVFLRTLK